MNEFKTCICCGEELPIEEFHCPPSRGKRELVCKNCVREKAGRKRTPSKIYCPVCNKLRPYWEFDVSKKSSTGRRWCCSECYKNKPDISDNHFRKRYDTEFKARINSQKRASRIRNFRRAMWRAAKNRAEHNGIPFLITPEDIHIPEQCPLLEKPFIYGTEGNYKYTPSLDRINNSLGYVPGNIWVISMLANTMKNDATIEELVKFCTNMLRYSPNCIEKENAELRDKELLG